MVLVSLFTLSPVPPSPPLPLARFLIFRLVLHVGDLEVVRVA